MLISSIAWCVAPSGPTEMPPCAPPIFTSVGREAINRPNDVFVIQALLNQRLPKPHAALPVTGKLDVGTVLAIEAYQAVVLKMRPPSGRVDPGSETYYALAARPLVMARVGAVVDAAKDPLGRIDINGRDMDGYSATNKQKEVILHEDKVFE